MQGTQPMPEEAAVATDGDAVAVLNAPPENPGSPQADSASAPSTDQQVVVPFKTLAALRRSHGTLLRHQRSPDPAERPGPIVLTRFMQRIQATGRNLASEEARSSAQGILDYWYGALVLANREAASALGILVLDNYDANAADADATEADAIDRTACAVELESVTEGPARQGDSLVKKAIAFSATVPAGDRAEFRRILQRLVHLSESDELLPAQLLPTDPINTGPVPARLITGLLNAGLLQPDSAAPPNTQAYVLASPLLFTDWPELEAVATQRQSLREMTKGWEKSGRQDDALLPRGELLQHAADYTDKNPSETSFIERSKDVSAAVAYQRKKLQIFLLSLSVAILASVAWSQYQKKTEIWTQKNDIEKQNIQIGEQAAELKKQIAIAEKARKDAEEATQQAKQQYFDAVQANVALGIAKEKADAQAKADQMEIKSLNEQIKTAKDSAANLAAIVKDMEQSFATVTKMCTAEKQSAAKDSLDTLLSRLQTIVKQTGTSQAQTNELAAQAVEAATIEQNTAPSQLPVKVLKGHGKPITAVAFNRAGLLATAGEDNLVRVWYPTGEKAADPILGSSKDGVRCLGFSPDGSQLAIGSNGSTVRLHDFIARQTRAYEKHSDSITSVAFNSAGTSVISASGDRTVQVWNAASLEREHAFGPLKTIPTSAAFNPQGTMVIASLDDPASAALVWNLGAASTAAPLELKAKTSLVRDGQFNQDGTLIVTANVYDHEAVIWDAETGLAKARLDHSPLVLAALFDPGGRHVATAGSDQTVKIWNVADGALLRTLAGHKGEVRHMAYSPDGNFLLTGSSDATARLWFGDETEARYILSGHTQPITAVAFNADGSQIATGSNDGTVRLWDLGDTQQPAATAVAGWSLYGWLDTKAPQPTVRTQFFFPQTGPPRTSAIPEKSAIITSGANMKIRDSITPGPGNKWQQGKPIGVLPKGASVEVLDVLADPMAHPPAVWVQFKRK